MSPWNSEPSLEFQWECIRALILPKKFYSVQVLGKGHVWDADEDFAVGAPFLSVPSCRL